MTGEYIIYVVNARDVVNARSKSFKSGDNSIIAKKQAIEYFLLRSSTIFKIFITKIEKNINSGVHEQNVHFKLINPKNTIA